MCGIAGVVYQDPERPVNGVMLSAMCDAIRHRGPDDDGMWTGGGAGLGHRRLSIIDLSPAGRQPMSNEDGSVWIVFNGEIYNFPELREELDARGHAFRSRTDTEVIVHLYEEMGPSCVERLHGMFAFALWDVTRRRLVLARDRLGKKPLKYAEVDGGLLFASELKALLASGAVPRDVDLGDVGRFLSLGYVPSPGTGFATIRKLPPAHVLVWERGRTTIERYWRLDFRRKAIRTEAEWTERIREEVRAAVRRRLISDVPLGAFLSGGIDSSIVVACMAEACSKVETFSIGFEHEAFDELPHARLIAERYATSHHEFVVKADDAEMLPRLARIYEEPYADPSALPSFFLARETRRFVTVALNGDGGDEGFAGYSRYARRLSWERGARGFRRLGLHAVARSLPAVRPPGRLSRQLEGLRHVLDPSPGAAYAWMVRIFSEREKAWLGEAPSRGGHRGSSSLDILSRLAQEPGAGEHLLDRMLYTDAASYLPDDLLVKMDLACMAHGLEARSPLLDHRLLELAATIPAEMKAPGGTSKRLLKEAFRHALPPAALTRRKQGFGIPLDSWFRGPLRVLAHDTLLAHDAHTRAYLRPEAVRALLAQHAQGSADRGRQIWALVMLELWHREVAGATLCSRPADLPAQAPTSVL